MGFVRGFAGWARSLRYNAARAATQSRRATLQANTVRTNLNAENAALGPLRSRRGRRGVRGAIDRARSSQTRGQGTVDTALDDINAGVAGFDKGTKAGMTIGHQLTKLAGIGLGATALNKSISSWQDAFGDKQSGFTNFMAGLTKFGITAAAGVTGVTAIGRTAILASGRFSSKSRGAAAVSRIRDSIKGTASSADDLALLSSAARAPRKIRQSVARTSRSSRDLANRMRGGGGPGLGYHGMSPATVRGMGNLQQRVQSHDRFMRNVMPLSRKSGQVLRNEAGLARRAGRAEANLAKNEEKIRMSYSMKSAKNFGAFKSILKPVGKFPFMAAGAMVGRGSVWGKIDPTMTYMGGAMAAGTLSGLGVGTAVGIGSIKRGNLRRTQEARPRPQERSFSNINYNATLHAHRMNM